MSQSKNFSIRKTARVHDKATDTYLDLIEFRTTNLKTARLQITPSDVNDARTFTKKLQDADALLPKNKAGREQLLERVASSDAPERLSYERQTGWTDNGKTFVFSEGCIGRNTKILGIRTRRNNYSSVGLSTAGIWESWRDMIGSSAQLSTTLMLTVSVAFAAPLLAITNRQSFGIHLYGESRTGKSMATLAGASILGTASLADLPSWNLTDAGLEDELPRFNERKNLD
jgi:putative DNA primase/helicase